MERKTERGKFERQSCLNEFGVLPASQMRLNEAGAQ